jgi:hypothetical protein
LPFAVGEVVRRCELSVSLFYTREQRRSSSHNDTVDGVLGTLAKALSGRLLNRRWADAFVTRQALSKSAAHLRRRSSTMIRFARPEFRDIVVIGGAFDPSLQVGRTAHPALDAQQQAFEAGARLRFHAPPGTAWREYFSQQRERLRPLLGTIADELQLNHSLATAGYRKIGAGFIKRRLFAKETDAATPAFHLHLVVSPTWPLNNELLLHDWLIQHPEGARACQPAECRASSGPG